MVDFHTDTAVVSSRIRSLTITRISEPEMSGFSPDMGAGQHTWLFPDHMLNDAGDVHLAVQFWLVEGPPGTRLVDTGIGNAKQRPGDAPFHDKNTDHLCRLAAAGVAPEQVSYVLITHLHVDYVGWNTFSDNGIWLPTFSNARCVFFEQEYRFFADPANCTPSHHNSFPTRMDSVDPVVVNDQAIMVTLDGGEIPPSVRVEPKLSHSPFHGSIAVESHGKTALFADDVMHHVSQILRPEVNSVFDVHAEKSRASRFKVLDLASDPDTLLFGAHIRQFSPRYPERRRRVPLERDLELRSTFRGRRRTFPATPARCTCVRPPLCLSRALHDPVSFASSFA